MNTQTNSTTRKIGVGIIGLSADGGWAAAAHYPSLSKLSDLFTIKGLTASSMAKAETAAQKYGVPFYSDDAAALAARDDIDLLVVAVNLPQHQALIEQIAPSGKAIYCEWPLGVNPAQSQEITDVAARHHCRSFIGLQTLTSPYIRKIQEILSDSATGKVISCTVVGGDPSRGKHIDARYRYAQLQENGVSTLTIPFAHLLAALRYWFGDLVNMSALTACQYPQVTIAGSNEIVQRTATDHVFFQAQTAAGVLINAVYRGGTSQMRMEIVCEHLTLVITANSGHVQFEPLQIEIRREDKSEILPATSVAAENLCDTYRAVYADLQNGTQHVPDFSYAVAHQRILFELAGGV